MQTSLFTLTSQVCKCPLGLTLYPCLLTFLESSKSQRPGSSNRAQTPSQLPKGNSGTHWLCISSASLTVLGPRHRHVTVMKQTQRRAEAGAWHRHEGAAVPGVNWEESEVVVSGISFVPHGFGVFTCLWCCKREHGGYLSSQHLHFRHLATA